MKRIPLLILWALFHPALLPGQDATKEHASGEHPAHKELRALRAEMTDAFNKGDLERLLQYVTEDVVLTWQNAEVSRGHKGLRDYHQRMMVGENRVVESVKATAEVDELTRLYGPDKDTGMAFGDLEEDFVLTNGMAFHLSNRWTAHLVKEKGKWKVSAFHVSANLFHNPVLDQAVQRTAVWSGGIAALAGLIVGLVLSLVFRRRRQVAP